jgi:uncharacterized membrane protein YobD (UPF0266 family)
MDEEGKFWVRIWSLVAAVLVVLILCVTAYNIYETRLMVHNGYTQVQVTTQMSTRWVKP